MQNFDDYFIIMFRELAQKSNSLTNIMLILLDNEMLKGGVIVAILWYFWFTEKSVGFGVQEKIITTFLTCIIAILVARAFSILLPFRPRPILNPAFIFFYEKDKISWTNTWSSFPSDHAVLFFSLATSIFHISRKIGILTFIYVLIMICLPRIYLGFHYPTDIIGGAVLGISMTWIISVQRKIKIFSKKIISLSIKFPGIFYTCLFLLSYQIVTLFKDSLVIASFFINNIRSLF